MSTGKRLLNYCMPLNYKQGSVCPTSNYKNLEKPYGNRKAKKAGHVRKTGQNKLRKQLKKELSEEIEISLEKGE